MRPDGGVVTRRIANPFSLVQIQVRPPISDSMGAKHAVGCARRGASSRNYRGLSTCDPAIGDVVALGEALIDLDRMLREYQVELTIRRSYAGLSNNSEMGKEDMPNG